MKNPDDLDRLLDQWLQDGPTRPPEAPLEHAIQHARSRPRRRDPLGFLRPDPMAKRTTRLGLQPAFMLAMIGLIIVAAVGAVFVGSLPKEPQVIVTPSPPPASVAPSASAAPTPAASLHVELKDELDSGATVDIVDLSGTVASARAAEVDERAPAGAVTSGEVTIGNVDATTLWIGWTAGNCPDAHVMTIDATGRSISISQPPFCGGDTIGVGRQLVLTFAQPIAAGDVAASIEATASPSPAP